MDKHKLLEIADFWPAKALLSAAELGLFGSLRRPTDASKIAERLKLDEAATARLMDALVGMGILEKTAYKYCLVENIKEFLLPGPECIVPMLMHRVTLWDSWSDLTDTIRFGKTLDDPQMAGERSSEEVKSFIGAMKVVGTPSAIETVQALDLRKAESLLDIGGGPGVYAAKFAEHNPDLKVTILDLPKVCKIAKANLKDSDVGERISFIEGDVLKLQVEDVSMHTDNGFDVVFLSNLIHSLGSSEVQLLLAKCAMWIKPGGRIVVKDFLLDDTRTNPPNASLFGINMLVCTPEGNCYTWTEIEEWLTAMIKLRNMKPKLSRVVLGEGRDGLCIAKAVAG